jgi:cell division protein FtsZ
VNAVNRMIEAGLRGVEFIAVNTDAQTLLMSDAEVKLDIGRETTAASAPARTRSWARTPPTSMPTRRGDLEGRRHGVHHRRRGRRTGTVGSPVVAEIARNLGAPRSASSPAVRLEAASARRRPTSITV